VEEAEPYAAAEMIELGQVAAQMGLPGRRQKTGKLRRIAHRAQSTEHMGNLTVAGRPNNAKTIRLP
jgi:hypothetical protein